MGKNPASLRPRTKPLSTINAMGPSCSGCRKGRHGVPLFQRIAKQPARPPSVRLDGGSVRELEREPERERQLKKSITFTFRFTDQISGSEVRVVQRDVRHPGGAAVAVALRNDTADVDTVGELHPQLERPESE